MNQDREQADLVDLGAVSGETKGMPQGREDYQGGLFLAAGLGTE